MAMRRPGNLAVVLVAAVVMWLATVTVTTVTWGLLFDEGISSPAVVVYEDGSGTLPEGSSNSVLGDLSGRGFCLYGEMCEWLSKGGFLPSDWKRQ